MAQLCLFVAAIRSTENYKPPCSRVTCFPRASPNKNNACRPLSTYHLIATVAMFAQQVREEHATDSVHVSDRQCTLTPTCTANLFATTLFRDRVSMTRSLSMSTSRNSPNWAKGPEGQRTIGTEEQNRGIEGQR
jgi:hypothetical protein